MKKLFLLIMSGLALMLAGCGDVTVYAPIVIDTPPSITVLSQDLPDFALFGQGMGIATAHASVDFFDPDGDVSAISISVVNSRGIEVSRTVTSLPDYIGLTRGNISFSIDFNTLLIENYSFTVYLTDRRGNVSNPVFGSYRVIR